MSFTSCVRYGSSLAVALSGTRRLQPPCCTLQRGMLQMSCLVGAQRFCAVCCTRRRLQRTRRDADVLTAVTTKKREAGEAECGGMDLDMELEPVDLKKLALPLHLMETIPPAVVANIVAKDKTIVFSPHRKQKDVSRRLFRMKHRYSIQPLGMVLHFRFFALHGDKQDGVTRLADITPDHFHRIKEKLRTFTRFIVLDERWPLEVSVEVTPIMQRSPTEIKSIEDVVHMLSRVMAEELHVGAWCGISSTPILAKMACEASQKQHPQDPKAAVSGGILCSERYDLPTHEAVEKFVANIPLSDVPVMGKAQVELLKSVYGIRTCGDILAQDERLGFTFSQQTMEFFLSVAYGVMRVESEIGTTLRQKGARCKSAQVRRESRYGRVISEEQFIKTVLAVFDTVHRDLLLYDFVAGRISLDTRRFAPRVFWVTEEFEDVTPRTNNRERLQEAVLRLAKRFAPRRTKEMLDMYILSIHLSDVRTWTEEYEGGTHASCRARRGSTVRKTAPVPPSEKKSKMRLQSSMTRKDDANKPRGIKILM
ncbi:DNA-directed DNA polymerase [Trypanosoma rangeli]|uniref:DNA-directed DNA polymerase n=1 Tax=Trypanosoma rangeli TaxID=5698 RepID=A0A3R7LGC2_TRYRA|nr:DNA-directed DNA polymerase [Trypanosoma rangeli]RNE96740.1 DNA-directed DNA polymerase [Trypanosoma rangeli]|eukprot:RNE96740.1 DNA-directed DNA polymerase [Trypanosoma rangeli]